MNSAVTRDTGDFQISSMPSVINNGKNIKRIAYFVSPHGFGHAARAAAVMQAIAEIDAAVQFEIFTTVPQWFFQDSLSAAFSYHSLLTDIGLAQKTAFEFDLEDTLCGLNDFFPIAPSRIADISEKIRNLNCVLVICDIAPMGILVARKAGIASVLVENFTWDWIYQQDASFDSGINRHIDYLQPIFDAADYHIQTEPVCRYNSADLLTAPASRTVRVKAKKNRERLGLPSGSKMVLITSGGIPQSYDFIDKLLDLQEISFVMPGAGPELNIRDNLVILPHRSDFFHPDLVNASDAVIGKIGYSTLAEVYHVGIPFGYVARSNYRESEPMESFIQKTNDGCGFEGIRVQQWQLDFQTRGPVESAAFETQIEQWRGGDRQIYRRYRDMIKQIISGGQTGVDRAALDAAIKLAIAHGGWIPRGRLTESGPLPPKYHLKEIKSFSYSKRTEKNVIDADGTLIISRGPLTGGSEYTREMAVKHRRPWLHIDLSQTAAFQAAMTINKWILEKKITILNVAGPRASKDSAIYRDTLNIIESAYYLGMVESKGLDSSTAKNSLDPQKKNKKTAPQNVDQAVKRLISDLPLKDKATIANMSPGELPTLNSTLGRYIINNFSLMSGNPNLIKSCQMASKTKIQHEEDAAGVIINALWEGLQQTHKLRVVK